MKYEATITSFLDLPTHYYVYTPLTLFAFQGLGRFARTYTRFMIATLLGLAILLAINKVNPLRLWKLKIYGAYLQGDTYPYLILSSSPLYVGQRIVVRKLSDRVLLEG